jgi:hypothetical protein
LFVESLSGLFVAIDRFLILPSGASASGLSGQKLQEQTEYNADNQQAGDRDKHEIAVAFDANVTR